ncbi:MAG TPA: hypothetical protein VFU22_20115 [Roseiflexaceae bacterium]|nr:hypothetical protein [Roseiflexaceae bacterium]
MVRRSIFGLAVAIVALLALATPALAGGWAVVTLDSLPREVHAGTSFQLGFTVLQHGKTPTNQDLNGKPLKPVITAMKQGASATTSSKAAESIRVEARQQGATGHFVADLTLPSDGVWEWQIAVPTFYVQDSPSGSNAAIMAPLTVLPAAPAAAAKPAVAEQPAAAQAAEPTAPVPQGVSSVALRWGAVIMLVAALALALYAQRGAWGRRLAQTRK